MLSIRFNNPAELWINEKYPQRITKIKSFINKCIWKVINFPSEIGDWKINEKHNVAYALNVFYSAKEKIYLPYVSKHNPHRWKQVVLLMISNREK